MKEVRPAAGCRKKSNPNGGTFYAAFLILLSVTKEVRPTAAGRKISNQNQKSAKLFLDSSFGDERRIALRQADGDRETAHERRITPRQAAGHLPTKEVRSTAAGRKSSDESVCPLSSSPFRRCKTEERPRSTLRPLPALRLMAQTRDMIARAGKNQKAPSGKSSNLLFPDLTLAGPPAHRVYCNWEVFQTRNHISRYITFQRQS